MPGKSAAQQYFGEWYGYIDQVKSYLQGSLGGGLQLATGQLGTGIASSVVNHNSYYVSCPVTVQGLASEELEHFAQRSADVVADKVTRALEDRNNYSY